MIPDTMFGNSPEDMLARLGSPADLRTERVTRIETENGRTTEQDYLRFTNERLGREMTYTRAAGGGGMVEYRQRTGDGWESQTFFQGTKDTVVERSSRDGRWEVTRREENFAELSRSNSGLPASRRATTRSMENGSLEDLNRALELHPQLGDVHGTRAWQDFQAAARGANLRIVAGDTETPDGRTAQLVVETPTGERLVVVREPSGRLLARTEDERGTSPPSMVLPDGASPEEAFRVAGEGLRLPGRLDAPRGGYEGHAGPLVTGANLVLDAVSLAADLEHWDRDPERALRRAATMGWDVNQVSLALANSRLAARVSAGAGSASRMIRGVSAASRMAGTAARFLGAAGGLANGYFAIRDFSNGNYVEGGLGVIGLLGIVTGPVGWIASGLSALGSLVWNSDKADRIADFQLS
ncbi:MAG: hypothetical protein HY319_22875 [Armatimonadetes bacterium]|nr:hypothetical protein [Armatimonadota bacterium]